MARVLTLIADDNGTRGVFDESEPMERRVKCTIRSVGMREAYEAMGHGLKPELVFQLPHSFEYHGEKTCLYNGIKYRVIRTYITETDGIEITVERGNSNV